MSWSDDHANEMLDAEFAVHATHYLGLSTTAPNADGTGVNEPVGLGYARVAVTSADFDAAAGRRKVNGAAIAFPAPTGAWGTLGWVVDYTASSGGTLIQYGALALPRTVSGAGSPLAFAAGSIAFGIL